MLAYAIEPKSRGDEDKISTAMHRLEEEDPTIHYSRDPQTKELLLAGQGQLHIEVTVAKLKRRFGVEVNLKPPRIPYRETIKARPRRTAGTRSRPAATASSATARSRSSRSPRGSDFEFVDDIFGGSIPRQFIPAVEKGIQEARQRGFLAGYPMVDFRVTVFDGSYHDVDSNELSFKMAGSLAFKDAHVAGAADAPRAGDARRGLRAERLRRRPDGRPERPPRPHRGMDTRGATTVIKAQVPMAEMLTYEQHLTSTTGGRGSYHMEFSHYDEVPRTCRRRSSRRRRPSGAGVEVRRS